MSKLIPAVGYLRKSSKGERKDGKQKQEKSIPQQKEEIKKLAVGRFRIVEWFTDEGVPGWKRGAKRPDFQRMLGKVKELGAEAILCDNIDRFSRGAYGDVQEDANSLRRTGVRWIVTSSHGEYDLGARYDIGAILKFAVAVWAASEYSRQLGRRIALSRRNNALEGKRSGGPSPYAYASDGNGNLKFDVPEKVKAVRWIFDRFANKGDSLNGIVSELNRKKFPPSKEGKGWGVSSVKFILRNPAYVGDFTYGRLRCGQFYTTNSQGEVVEVEKVEPGEPIKAITKQDSHSAMVSRETFAKAQRRLAEFATGRKGVKRLYALSGILECGGCGRNLSATKKQGYMVYRCTGNQIMGKGECEQWQVREDQILPWIVATLAAELKDLSRLATRPPQELIDKPTARERKALERKIAKLKANIASGTESLFDADSTKATRKEVQQLINEKRSELGAAEAELAVVQPSFGFNEKQLQELAAFWEQFDEIAVRVPVDPVINLRIAGGLQAYQGEDESIVQLDPMVLNTALRELGTKVTLRWETIEDPDGRVKVLKRKGKVYKIPIRQHKLVGGRFQLGQKKGKLPRYVLDTTAPRLTRIKRARRGRTYWPRTN